MARTATPTTRSLAEFDKKRQLLFLVRGGETVFIHNASAGDDREYTEPDGNSPGEMITGKAITPVGEFKIN